jgi:hypothetical protein
MLAAVLITVAGVSVVLAVYAATLSNQDAAERDFIAYWAAGQLLAHGQNPYDFEEVRRLELGDGRDPAEPLLMMRNPPVALPLVLPLGFAGPKTMLIAWFFVLMGALLLAVWLVWRLNGKPDNLYHLLALVYAPALACLMAGQFGILMLLGMALFLTLHRSRPFLAGVALLFCSLKPHYFVPFFLVFLLWSLASKSFRAVAGLVTAVAASSALVYALDSHAWLQYLQMMHAGGALNEVIPDLSAELRLLVDPRAVWIEFVPEAAACIWAGWYFWSHRARWSWTEHGLLVLLVGALCAPYGWFFDESVLYPAVLAGVYRANEAHRPIWPLAMIVGAALLELLLDVKVVSHFYLWTTPAWLGWYLYATGRFSRRANAAD